MTLTIILVYLIIGCVYCGFFIHSVAFLGKNWNNGEESFEEINSVFKLYKNREEFRKLLEELNAGHLIALIVLWLLAIISAIKMNKKLTKL